MDLKDFVNTLTIPAFSPLRSALVPGRSVDCAGIAGSLKSVLVARLRLEEAARPVLWVVHNAQALERAENDLKNILGDEAVCLFPEYDALPGERRPPHGRIVEERLRTLDALVAGSPCAVVATAAALVYRMLPPAEFLRNTLDVRAGEEMDLSLLAEWLAERGFTRTPIIDDAGQFSVRGGIVDVFPLLSENPVRIEFFGDTVESVRAFDVFSQRSIGPLQRVRLVPVREVVVSASPEPGGLEPEWRVPTLTKEHIGLFDYLPAGSTIILDETPAFDFLHTDTLGLLTASFADKALPVDPGDWLLSLTALEASFVRHAAARFLSFRNDRSLFFDSTPQPVYNKQGTGFFPEFKSLQEKGWDLTVACENAGQAKRFQELSDESDIVLRTVLGNLEEGFMLNGSQQALFTENRLFGRYVNRIRFRKYKGGTTLHHVSSLKKGDYVVHVDHGIGRFRGLERISVGTLEKDCVIIEYEGNDTVSVPVEDLGKVQKYASGEDDVRPALSKLGGKTWERTRAKAKAALNKIVQELVELYAQRKYFEGFAYPADTAFQVEFEESFIYEDTPDQKRAAEEIKADLKKPSPMDRLVCGDAGVGKTEVAMRAAFKVAESGRQVAVLVPTTLLAFQHHASFSDRFRDYPVRTGVVSRFSSPAEIAETLKGVQSGSVDILIGTHRLLSKDVEFKDLGLLIIDEEHRFGVRHKEKIKEFKTQLDVLSMTATPIPRTLQLSLTGARDMSLITTPPRNRLPIQTRIVERDDQVVREAILRERARGGQVFFVHNRVMSIDREADRLRALIPGLRVGVGHGQMGEKELEDVMVAFLNRETDVLVSTAIIESGLDIPNVNTILLDQADHLGLAQLYQLRGRVGRSSIQAYAYLLVNSLAALTDESRRRLKAMEQLTEFGAGFQVAMRDLEIRGAGNLLGERQHGLLCQVGYEMYHTMLQEAVLEIKEKKKITRTDPAVRVEARAFLPHDYVPETQQRLEIYQRLSRVDSAAAVDDIAEELADRFGPVPEPVTALLSVIFLKYAASTVSATAVTVRPGRLTLEFAGKEPITAEALGQIMTRLPQSAQVNYDTSLTVNLLLTGGADALENAKNVLRNLL
ncbi:MAG: transcription-repair coupling factor [Fibrobacterota bacterium]